MIRVLIVDDRPEKIAAIRKVLVERCSVSDETIDEAKSVSTGLKALKRQFYDLVLLDLLLPQFDDDETASEDGGLSFLKSLNSAGDLTLPLQIICLTEYAYILNGNRGEYDRLMVSSIVKKDGDSQWIDQIAALVNYSQRLRCHVEEVLVSKNKFDVGIICALQEEFEMLLDAFGRKKWTDFELDGIPYRFKEIHLTTEEMQPVRVVAACACQAGGAATAALASLMYGSMKVDYLFMTGITGGIKQEDKICLGDVVIAKSIQDYAAGKVAEQSGGDVRLLKENVLFQAHADLLNKMSEFVADNEVVSAMNARVKAARLKVQDREQYAVHIAPTASGPFVMTSTTMVAELKKADRKLSAVDMEGYALYCTAHAFNKPALWIKGVSDMMDASKDDRYHQTASYASACLLLQFIKDKLYC